MGVGIVMSACFAVPTFVLLPTLLAVIVVLYVLHRFRLNVPFFLVSCVFFLLLGFVRGHQGGVELLPDGVYHYAYHLSQLAQSRLHSLGLSADTTSLLDAMLLGRREGLTSEMRHLYSGVGASHVLALSGLHLGILFGIFNFCLMRVLACAPLRYTLGCFTIFVMWAYALVAGLPVSLVRASVMMSLFLVSQIRFSGVNGWHYLGVAAMVILFFSPASLWSVSFQLSFAAVVGILLLYSPIHNLLHIRDVFLYWLWSGVVVSLSAQIMCFPLVAHYFHQVSTYSLILSPLYIFIATLILFSALLAFACGGIMAMPVSFLVCVQHTLMHLTSLLPFAMWNGLHPSWAQILLQYVAIFCLVPALKAARTQQNELKNQRLAYFLRRWPYITATVVCLLAAYLIN